MNYKKMLKKIISCKKMYYVCSMKTINISDEFHDVLKKESLTRGMKLGFLIESLLKKALEPNPVEQTLFPAKEVKKKTKEKGKCLFRNSNVAEYMDFQSEFLQKDWALKMSPIDPHKLYMAVKSWSDANAAQRLDWMAVAYNFARKSLHEYRPDGYSENPKDAKWKNFYNTLVQGL